jgi:hypothetical protein
MCRGVWLGNMKEEDNLEDTLVVGRIRGLFKKYWTFDRQKYSYLFGCLKP